MKTFILWGTLAFQMNLKGSKLEASIFIVSERKKDLQEMLEGSQDRTIESGIDGERKKGSSAQRREFKLAISLSLRFLLKPKFQVTMLFRDREQISEIEADWKS